MSGSGPGPGKEGKAAGAENKQLKRKSMLLRASFEHPSARNIKNSTFLQGWQPKLVRLISL